MLLFWIAGGAFLGWVTGKLMSSERRDQVMDVVMGVAGAVEGALLFSASDILVQGKMIHTMLAAIVGAVILTLLARSVGGRLEYGSTD